MMKKIFLFLFCIVFCIPTTGALNNKIDHIVVKKTQRQMYLKNGDSIIKQYRIALGGNPIGSKQKEGDQKTPEGKYYIEFHNPKSSYHLSLRISYPNAEQKEWATKNNYSAGGDIMIHGYPNWAPNVLFDYIHKNFDWTDGCIAVTNSEITEIYNLVKDGTPIEIYP